MDEEDDEIQTNTSFIVVVTTFIVLSCLLGRVAASRWSSGREGSALGDWWWNRAAEDKDVVVAFFFLLPLLYLIFYMEVGWMSLMPVLVPLSLVFAYHYGATFWTLDRVAWCCRSLSNLLVILYNREIMGWPVMFVVDSLKWVVGEVQKTENKVLIVSLAIAVGSMWYRGSNPITKARAVLQTWTANREAREVQQGPFVNRSLFDIIAGYFYWHGVTEYGFLTVPPPGEQRRAAGTLAAGARAPAPAQSAPAPAPAPSAPSSPTTVFAPPAGGIQTPPRPATWSS